MSTVDNRFPTEGTQVDILAALLQIKSAIQGDVNWLPVLLSGTTIATITIGENSYTVYAPTPPTKTSDITNDSGFITNTVNNLANYYLKTDTYTKTEVNNLISAIDEIHIEVVATLPTTDISTNTIYFVPKSTAQTDNVYDEYINTDGTTAGWEKIGDTEIDLSNYYTKSETDTLLNGKVDKVAGKGLSTEDYTSAEKTKLGGIESGAEVNVQSDWSQSDNTADDYIKNKPSSEVKSATDTFTTVNGGLLEECNIDLVPIQDLHGYDSPWVGGAGKNKLPMTVENLKSVNTIGSWSGNVYTNNNVTFTILTNADNNVTGIKINTSEASARTEFMLMPNTTVNFYNYKLTGCPSGGGNSTYKIQLYDQTLDIGNDDIGSGITISATDGDTCRVLIIVYSGASINNQIFYPMVRKASESDPTFEPYSNICPISGHTAVEVENNDGNNLANQSAFVVGSISGTGEDTTSDRRLRSPLIKVKPNTAYGFSVNLGLWIMEIHEYDVNGSWLRYSVKNTQTATHTFSANAYFTKILVKKSDNSVITDNSILTQMMMNEGALKPYTPYIGYTITVNLGGTYYGGTVDLVSGVMNVLRATMQKKLSDAGRTDPEGTGYTRYRITLTEDINVTNRANTVCDKTIYLSGGGETLHFNINSGGNYLYIHAPNNMATSEEFTFVYPLATPFTIQLTPQQIETLVGQNNLSTPLSGQSIDSVEYREVFAFDDVEKVVSLRVPISMLGTDESGRTTASQSYASGDYFYKDGYMCKALTSISAGATLTLNTNYEYSTLDKILESKVDKSDIYANAGSHNSIYRGKYLGSSVTAEQWSAIQNGTFDDLFIGDYWTINGVNWRIAHFDYWLNTGDTNCTTHHVVIVPDTNLYNAQMNTENVTTGGYYSSKMRGGSNYLVSGSSNLYNAKTAIDNAFGSAHILSHRELLTNGVSNGNASGWAWYDSTVDLMSEVMVYGTLAWSVGGKGYEVGIDKEQLALFRLDHSRICNRARWWLRCVISATHFAYVDYGGHASYYNASYSFGVRPAFAIK